MPESLRRWPYRLAAGFHDSGADEQAAGAEPVVAHAGRVVLEVAQGRVQLILLDACQGIDAGGRADSVDVAAIEVLEQGKLSYAEAAAVAAAAVGDRPLPVLAERLR
jgi:hypothetical protein